MLQLRPAGSDQHYALWRIDSDKRLYLEKYRAQSAVPPSLVYRKAYPPSLLVTALVMGEQGGLVRIEFEIDNDYTPRTVPRRNSVVAMLGGG